MGKKKNLRAGFRLDLPGPKNIFPGGSSKGLTNVKSQSQLTQKPYAENVPSQSYLAVELVSVDTMGQFGCFGSTESTEMETILDNLFTKAWDNESLQNFVEVWESVYKQKMELRAKNLSPSYEEFEALLQAKKLDSRLKKCTGFVKKLKNFTNFNTQKDFLEKDIQTLNLSKYLGEIATAIVKTNITMSASTSTSTSNRIGILHICSLIHQRYSEFSSFLLENLTRTMAMAMPQKNIECSAINLKKISSDLHLLGNLLTVGILPLDESYSLLLASIKNVTAGDKNHGMHCLNSVLSFCARIGDEMAGIFPKSILKLCEEKLCSVKLSRYDVVPVQKRIILLTYLTEYFNLLCSILVKNHDQVLKSEIHNRKLMKHRGEVPEDRRVFHDEIVTNFENFKTNVANLAELLNLNLPELRSLPPPAPDEVEDRSLLPTDAEMATVVPGIVIFEDEDTRSFYQDLPDLKLYLLPTSYKESILQSAEEAKKIEEREKEKEKELSDVDAEISVQAEFLVDDADANKFKSEEDPEDLPLSDTEEEKCEGEDAEKKPSFQIFLSSLLNFVTKQMIDKAAMEFAMNYNNRLNRKKLIRTLFNIPRQRVDLLPLWARFIAILAPVMSDVSLEICTLLKNDFRFLIRKKHQIFIERKLKTTRYIAELIEMACVFVETCGRLLHRSAESRRRMTIYLDEMMRKKSVMVLEPRFVSMIDHAYYFVCPREGLGQKCVNRKRPGVAYLRNLILNDLNKDNLESTLLIMKGLDWSNEKVVLNVLELLCQPWETSSDQLRYLAAFAAGVSEIYPEMKTTVTDTILELIYYGMENPDTNENYRRIAVVRYLGELYNYKLAGSYSIFSILYLLICYSQVTTTPTNTNSKQMDPPQNLTRIRLVCTLLKTCGGYLNHRANRKKLIHFIPYFQRYYWNKKACPVWNEINKFPFAIEELMEDTMRWLRPKVKFPKSYEEACEQVQEMEAKMVKYVEEFFQVQPNLLDLDSDVVNNTSQINSTPTPIHHEHNNEEVIQAKVKTSIMDSETSTFLQASYKADKMNYEEDEVFNLMCDKMCAEINYDASRDEGKRMKSDIPIPLKLRSSSRSVPTAAEENSEGEKTVNFVLITRKGSKQNYKNLPVPADSKLVQTIQQREEDERMEREKVKELTLGITRMQEAEEEQEAMAKLQDINTYFKKFG